MTPQHEANTFNAMHPVGTLVRFWRGARKGEGGTGCTTSEAYVLGNHTAVVMIDGTRGCIGLSHVQVLDEWPAEEAVDLDNDRWEPVQQEGPQHGHA